MRCPVIGSGYWLILVRKTDLESLSESVRQAIGVRPEIEITPRAKIFDPEKSLKAKRLLDLRKSP